VLKTLTYREREIIKLRYGLGDGYTYTLEEVGRIFKVTRERVRQIEAKAVRKLQHPVRSRQLEGFLDGLRNRQASNAPPTPGRRAGRGVLGWGETLRRRSRPPAPANRPASAVTSANSTRAWSRARA